ncbi:hypothetical protein DENIS_2278 [Desulfonema ishimotonii]|uniref:Cohesin domain-containing protein n=1 Tax=Desulfonema ishimotonii TaxID=45657 RepID=A0A401FWH3_9BACT|nr:hypothetical protein [Desulfonema ishimotonii]GBC61318.1 hypothetical protein DENIS_2278 [Desulfonema ishimotonii]
MLRVLITAALLGCALLHGGAVRCHALSVDFGLSSPDVAAGTPFTVELFADIGKNEQILGWDIDLLFDPLQIAFMGATPGSDWVFPPTPLPDDDVSIAGLAAFGLSSDAGIYGEDILLATIFLECLTAGTSVLDIYTQCRFLKGGGVLN